MQIREMEEAAEVLRISTVKAENCMQCGKCSAACPAGARMDILPHRFVWELMNGRVSLLAKSGTLWQCLSCFACSARCPRGVDPARLIEAVRLTVIRRQGANSINVDELPQVIDENMPQQAIVSALRKYNK
ncbi:MAG: 4Fe-4S dicluster domain-containing protein [Acholeplasmataceae bacterium]|jgi:heterodisulfide reductase subunit C|nr:4Fe-4S dicluster domain-containing protein [Acidaminococcaceae bacterium]NLY84552.1 4Fe-4S dicluster domain-containing protein [Acholeplasmataceae bacterium]